VGSLVALAETTPGKTWIWSGSISGGSLVELVETA
jgi:hypothetical protein